jgi:transposase
MAAPERFAESQIPLAPRAPSIHGPYTTCYNRFVRWRRAGVWDRIMNSLSLADDAGVQMIDTSIVRVHQHGASITRNRRQSMGRSRGGLTRKMHAVVDTNGLPVRLALTAGEAHDNRLAGRLLSRLRPEQCCTRTVAITPIGLGRSLPKGAFGRTFHRDAIATSPSASARTSTALATWSNGSSIGSITVGGSRRATTNLRPTTWPSFSSLQYGCGYVLMSPRPNLRHAVTLRLQPTPGPVARSEPG